MNSKKCNSTLQQTGEISCLIEILWGAKVDVLTKRCELKYMLRSHFDPAVDWTSVFSSIIQCCELKQFWKGSADQNVVSRVHSQTVMEILAK